MKTRILLLVISLLFVCAPSMAEDPHELTVMSFNVRYGLAPDGENAWPKRRELVVDCVKEYAPDIMGLQECLDFQAEYMDAELPGHRYIGIGRDGNGQGEMTAVFYNWKVLLPVESGHFWLSETPEVPGSISWDSSLTRMVTWVKFYHIPSKRFFQFFNTHFDHRGETARLESAKLLRKRVEALKENVPVIITGDFNAAAPDSAPWQALCGGGIKDIWQNVENPVGPVTTWSAFKAPQEEGARRIDWVLYTDPFKPTHAETVLFNLEGRYPSDHYPVFARFTF